ncbi:unnamed protein product [Moneuplotes crassus]|uniref:Homeobox domain-containing protein n=1 Tax=Euplotes crassus TaxID=5936 RepID=A0AAD1ULF6_EUPCR|nr:unnamed protein product [Moneuplotes crassus]
MPNSEITNPNLPKSANKTKVNKKNALMLKNVQISEKKVALQDCYIMKKTRLIRVKTPEEVKFLESQFEKDPEWSRKTVQYCKEVLNLGTTQIYKWGFDKKLSAERRKKKLLKLNKSKNRPRKRKDDTKKPMLKCPRISEAGELSSNMSSGLAVSRIDYNLEVEKLVSEQTDYDMFCDNRRSDGSDNSNRKELQHILSTRLPAQKEKRAEKLQLIQKSSTNTGTSTVRDTWLDEIWDESFDADQYLSSSSDLYKEAPFLMEPDFEKKELPLMKTVSIPKTLTEVNEPCFKDLFKMA